MHPLRAAESSWIIQKIYQHIMINLLNKKAHSVFCGTENQVNTAIVKCKVLSGRPINASSQLSLCFFHEFLDELGPFIVMHINNCVIVFSWVCCGVFCVMYYWYVIYGGRHVQTPCNLRKHMQIDKTQANQENLFINLTTHAQHSANALQIKKHVANTHNTTKYINAPQIWKRAAKRKARKSRKQMQTEKCCIQITQRKCSRPLGGALSFLQRVSIFAACLLNAAHMLSY